MRRRSLTEVRNSLDSNWDDRDANIAYLLKKMCTIDQLIDYLLSSVIEQTKDDMLGELKSWDSLQGELDRLRRKQETLK